MSTNLLCASGSLKPLHRHIIVLKWKRQEGYSKFSAPGEMLSTITKIIAHFCLNSFKKRIMTGLNFSHLLCYMNDFICFLSTSLTKL